MSDQKQLPGAFVWFELVSRDAKKAQGFYGEVLGWKVEALPMGDFRYEMIKVGDTTIGGYAAPKHERQPSHWIAYVSVADVDATARVATAAGGAVIEAPYDVPGVGRMARIADPLGAELCLFRSETGDDVPDAGPGRWRWNELHTSDPTRAVAFYAKVLGYADRAMDMGPAGTYHVLSKGGVDRGGVMASANGPSHWLPYVEVDDADAAVTRAKKLGGTIHVAPTDIPGVGRFAVLGDPTGASIGLLRPSAG